MPEDGEWNVGVSEAQKVVDNTVQHLVRKGILLVEQNANEQTISAFSCR
jgi:hypothetical protein